MNAGMIGEVFVESFDSNSSLVREDFVIDDQLLSSTVFEMSSQIFIFPAELTGKESCLQ